MDRGPHGGPKRRSGDFPLKGAHHNDGEQPLRILPVSDVSEAPVMFWSGLTGSKLGCLGVVSVCLHRAWRGAWRALAGAGRCGSMLPTAMSPSQQGYAAESLEPDLESRSDQTGEPALEESEEAGRNKYLQKAGSKDSQFMHPDDSHSAVQSPSRWVHAHSLFPA